MKNNKPLSHNFILGIEIACGLCLIILLIFAVYFLKQSGGLITASHLVGIFDLILIMIGILWLKSFMRKHRLK